jgi:hypothetical protein
MMFVCTAGAQTLELPRTIRQGNTLRIHGPASAVTARINDRTIRLFPQPDDGSYGLMPVPVDQKPGDYKIELLDKGGPAVETASITVLDAHFPREMASQPAISTRGSISGRLPLRRYTRWTPAS